MKNKQFDDLIKELKTELKKLEKQDWSTRKEDLELVGAVFYDIKKVINTIKEKHNGQLVGSEIVSHGERSNALHKDLHQTKTPSSDALRGDLIKELKRKFCLKYRFLNIGKCECLNCRKIDTIAEKYHSQLTPITNGQGEIKRRKIPNSYAQHSIRDNTSDADTLFGFKRKLMKRMTKYYNKDTNSLIMSLKLLKFEINNI